MSRATDLRRWIECLRGRHIWFTPAWADPPVKACFFCGVECDE